MIPLSNYLKVFLIYIVTIIICLFAISRYEKYQEQKKKEPLLRGTIQEITANDIDGYINDNRDVLIYAGVATDDVCRKLEVDLKKLLNENDLTDDVVYLNLTNAKDITLFYKSFNEEYSIDKQLSSYPAFIIIRDGKVRDLVEKKKTQKLQVGDIDALLDQYEIKENK